MNKEYNMPELVDDLFFNISESARALRAKPDDYVSSFDIDIVQRNEEDDDKFTDVWKLHENNVARLQAKIE